MAALAVSPPRAARTPGLPGRPRRTQSFEATTEPPPKKRKYIPGGPGGGGRYLDDDGKEHATSGREAGTNGFLSVQKMRARRVLAENGVSTAARDAETPASTRSTMTTRPRRERPERYVPPPTTPRPRYSSSAAAAAAASQASDGYKPREERSWEDFHPDLDLDFALPIYTADEVDGRTKKDPKALLRTNSTVSDGKVQTNGDKEMKDGQGENAGETQEIVVTPVKRKPGRPPRRPESMLNGLGTPPAPRIMPLPTHNPKEKLVLPKPSFRLFNHFLQYEDNPQENKKNYVNKTMEKVGYQETDRFNLPPDVLIRHNDTGPVEDEMEVGLRLESDGPAESAAAVPFVGTVEYDMDEQDVAWLEEINEQRKSEGVEAITPAIFEITMTQIEKEYHALEKRIPKPQPRHAQMTRPRSSSQAAVNGDPNPPGDEPDSKCAICDDGDCENTNAIIFCDGCDLAVHQECYGVPFIPEGQWFCRKCRVTGRGTPTCIFCPNVDGAFKETDLHRWSHLLCALWIPEVTVANTTFMEPIIDVDRVPKSRWKLHCYICNQKMGACIQCGNKTCYQAFHVTCARRAKLFLKMKSPHQQGIDTSALKAFCDKHVPPDWRRTHDTDNAIIEAKRWYRHAMKDRRWANSQSVALELGAPPPPDGGLEDGEDDTIAVTKRRKNQPNKPSWRLPSGAPVVPNVVFATVEASLTRFTVRKRKEFVERVCRYWTLKREARRGAALLKRLQLQLETFSSMEVTRRNFASMGAVGRPRLERRIGLVEALQQDLQHVVPITAMIKERAELQLKDVELLRELVDTMYFPITPLLEPILQKARKLDEKTKIFQAGLDQLAVLQRERYFTSVADFSTQLSIILTEPLTITQNNDGDSSSDRPAEFSLQKISTRLNEAKRGSAEYAALSAEQKEATKLAKRILKAVKEPLEDATRKEAALRGKDQEELLRKLDSMGLFASAMKESVEDASPAKGARRDVEQDDEEAAAGALEPDVIAGAEDVEMGEAEEAVVDGAAADTGVGEEDELSGTNEAEISLPVGSPGRKKSTPPSDIGAKSNSNGKAPVATEPLSPPISTSPFSAANNNGSASAPDPSDFFAAGGVPWYLAPFDPHGTTVHEERYTGREVLRGMSEELSDMDEDTLTELHNESGLMEVDSIPKGNQTAEGSVAGVQKKKPKRKGRRAIWDRRRR